MSHGRRVLQGALLWLWLVGGAVLAQTPGPTPTDGVPLRSSQPAVQVEPAPTTATAAPIERLFPKLTGLVVDTAQLLTPSAQVYLAQMLERLEQTTTDQVVVATVPSLGGHSIEEFGLQLGRHWGIGRKDKNNGVLLLVAKDDRKVRIEVGYGLEGRLNDMVAHFIIDGSIIPYFKDDLYSSGIIAGATSIVSVLSSTDRPMLVYRSVEKSWYQDIEWMWWFERLFYLVFVGVPLFGFLTQWRSGDDSPVVASGDSARRETRAERDTGSSSSAFDWFDSSSSSSSSSSDSFSGGGGSFGGGGASGSW
ncbi:uncharacterized protein QF008_000683 [Pseudomonas protegens]|jgi:uncharacterized protein|uniref:TPM domain-containing protein n=1 Tax=Pseudomonas protegens TaxID=380021 RepID=UPI000F478AA3|nr:TPM domain-containing protein [Pseudomonas protegens]MDT3418952.1 uncharacterized protein [Pseudomonas protegens]ROM21575.1 hypothetical protein BK644_27440 [Pseudomonas protegens]